MHPYEGEFLICVEVPAEAVEHTLLEEAVQPGAVRQLRQGNNISTLHMDVL